MSHREFTLTAADGRRLFAQSWAPAEKAAGAVAIVHGLGEHSGRYAEMASQLVQTGYYVLAFDQRGHGRTGGQRGHVENYRLLLDDMDVLLREARRRSPGTPLFLYGHSLGGSLVLNYALERRPELAGLVAASPLLRLVSPLPAWKMIGGRLLSRLVPRFPLRSGVKSEDLSRDPAALHAREKDPLVHGRVSARLGAQMLDAGQRVLDRAGQLAIPTLIMHGNDDPLTSWEASAEFARRAGRRCEFRLWEGLLHELHEETERAVVVQFVIQWLEKNAQ